MVSIYIKQTEKEVQKGIIGISHVILVLLRKRQEKKEKVFFSIVKKKGRNARNDRDFGVMWKKVEKRIFRVHLKSSIVSQKARNTDLKVKSVTSAGEMLRVDHTPIFFLFISSCWYH